MSVVETRVRIAGAGVALIDERRPLGVDELADLVALPDESIPSLAALAHEVRLAWRGSTVEVEGILSAKSGGCPEDCHAGRSDDAHRGAQRGAVIHCDGCGRAVGDCPNGGRCTRTYEPPRYCPQCGHRMAVQVTPTGWHARCRDYGEQHR